MRTILRSSIPTASALLLAALLVPSLSLADEKKRPELEGIPVDGFQQLMPRGGIPALVDPTFVSAADADLPDEAWVMGFARDGESFAYDLNLLNRYEVVNHGTEVSKFAAVW